MEKKQINPEEIPTLSDAKKWLTPLIFLWHGRKWEVKPNCQIVEVKEKNAPIR